jgi:hypothetical protein
MRLLRLISKLEAATPPLVLENRPNQILMLE